MNGLKGLMDFLGDCLWVVKTEEGVELGGAREGVCGTRIPPTRQPGVVRTAPRRTGRSATSSVGVGASLSSAPASNTIPGACIGPVLRWTGDLLLVVVVGGGSKGWCLGTAFQ